MSDSQLSIADLLAEAAFRSSATPTGGAAGDAPGYRAAGRARMPDQVAVAALKALRLWYVIAMTESQQQADELRRFRGKT